MRSLADVPRSLLRRLPAPARDALRFVANPRRESKYFADWREFRRDTRSITGALERVMPRAGDEVLIHSLHGYVPSLKEDALHGAMLAASGIRPVYLAWRGGGLDRYLRVAPRVRVLYWEDFLDNPTAGDKRLAADLVNNANTLADLVQIEHDGIDLGRHVLSWFMRTRRLGTIGLEQHRGAIIADLGRSLAAARAADRVLDAVNVSSILMNERGYTPFGEFFDAAMKRGHRTVHWGALYSDDARVFKAYTPATRTEHPYSLSADTWKNALSVPFSADDRHRLLANWESFYTSRTWFNFQRLQHLTITMSREEVVAELGLDASKPTAALFAHIFWDATFFYGRSLYDDYQQWFVETVRLANQSTSVNWVIKLHPVNVWRLAADGTADAKYSEMAALEDAGIALAPHVKLVMPDTRVSSWSLFQAADYCFTVRGTVGIEMAMLGKRVVTAGTGHYSAHGFTVDPESREAYRDIVLNPTSLAPMSSEERDRAMRFANALFFRKAYRFDTHRFEYSNAPDAYLPLNGRARILSATDDAFINSPAAKKW
ncbi:MAG: hypothetical protein ABI442_08605, partial [Gemmatimonadaceae bacterium]